MLSANPRISLLVSAVSTGDGGLTKFLPDVVNMFIDMVRPLVTDELGDMGLALAVCHELALTGRGGNGAAGAMTEKREGQLARAYAAPAAVPAYWASSPYGLRFWGLVQRTILPVYNRQLGYADGAQSVMPRDIDCDNNFDGNFPGIGEV